MAALDRAAQRMGFINDVSIHRGHQRQSHATRAIPALEDVARTLGLSGIALHVFGHNPGAQARYVRLGYQITNLNMFKPPGPTVASYADTEFKGGSGCVGGNIIKSF